MRRTVILTVVAGGIAGLAFAAQTMAGGIARPGDYRTHRAGGDFNRDYRSVDYRHRGYRDAYLHFDYRYRGYRDAYRHFDYRYRGYRDAYRHFDYRYDYRGYGRGRPDFRVSHYRRGTWHDRGRWRHAPPAWVVRRSRVAYGHHHFPGCRHAGYAPAYYTEYVRIRTYPSYGGFWGYPGYAGFRGYADPIVYDEPGYRYWGDGDETIGLFLFFDD